MPKIDLSAVPVFDRLVYPAGLRAETAGYQQQRVGDAGGLDQFGVNRVVLPPRSRTALRHWHEQQDEFVIVITGEVVLRKEEGETILRDGDCAGFKSGVANGHAFENRSDGPVILFEIGTRTEDETVHYPDVDLCYEKRGTSRTFLHKDGTPYSE
jgi:uncharacterized cupin superfamily protein